MNYIDRLTHADKLARRTSQTRKVAIHSVAIDLPPDLHIPIHLAAKKAGVTPAALILDVLRDIFEPVLPAQHALIISAPPAQDDTRTGRAASHALREAP